jgi:hypothetical protein
MPETLPATTDSFWRPTVPFALIHKGFRDQRTPAETPVPLAILTRRAIGQIRTVVHSNDNHVSKRASRSGLIDGAVLVHPLSSGSIWGRIRSGAPSVPARWQAAGVADQHHAILAERGYPAGGLFGFLQAAFVAGANAEEDCSGQAEGDPAGIIGAT